MPKAPGQKPPLNALGSKMRAHRSTTTVEDAAVAVGLDVQSYYRFERGARRPNIQTAEKLAAWLGLTVGQVIDAARTPAE